MNNPQKYKKGAFLFSAGVVFNIFLAAMLFLGASVLTKKVPLTVKSLLSLQKKRACI